MSEAVRIDPETGLKVFNTRAAKASEKIAGKGYSVVTDQKLTELPKMPAGATFNAEEQAKYREFKEARFGAADYMAMDGAFKKYLDDVYSEPPIPREALNDECDILVVGAGFGGLLLWQKLREAGFTDVRFCEKGGDVGGTWYWNRYPGIACDVESYSYLPLLDETGYIPSMKFASGFEILEHCQRIAERFGFYDHCLFHTTVEATTWDEESGRWIVETDRGDKMRARFVVLANGILTTPKLARIKGMETFKGESFHTSRWDYNIDLTGKKGRNHRYRRHGGPGDSGARENCRGTLRVSAHALLDRRSCSTRDDSRRAQAVVRRSQVGRGTSRPLRPDFGSSRRGSRQ